jgi:hypothetical protein
MLIRTEQTPNPATRKFLPGETVMEAGSRDFADRDSADASPLASALFATGLVEGVFFGGDFISVTAAPGAAVTETKSRPKNTPSTSPVANSPAASGEAAADASSGKSRVPASITAKPGRNLRVAGLGVCSVRISMGLMWSRRQARSSAERRRSGNDPPADGQRREQADDRDPAAARPHRLDSGLQIGSAGNHRLR